MQVVKTSLSKFKNLPKHLSNNIVFKAYPKIDKAFKQFGIKDFRISIPKNHILYNVDKNLKIVFSTKIEDIITMSMRGIKSCQSWGERQDIHLIGSVADPFCGIIYITDGVKTKYGERMLARSLVRIVSSDRKTQCICFEPLYLNNSFIDSKIEQAIAELESKVPLSKNDEKTLENLESMLDDYDNTSPDLLFGKLFKGMPIVSDGDIPQSSVISDILSISEGDDSPVLSYSDKGLCYDDNDRTGYKDPYK